MIGKCGDGIFRHGVHRMLPNERFDRHHITIQRIFRARTDP
jgi:hypothetical protein